jgi:uncharacterized protein (TIGR00369 family)
MSTSALSRTTPTVDDYNRLGADGFPGLVGLVVQQVERHEVRIALPLRPALRAPNGFLHAGALVTLADTAAGYGCVANLPEGASGFTTIEIKTNYLGTAKIGEQVTCEARLLHGGRMTQVWDAEATNATTGKIMAVFRCTQMVLYPR